MDEQGRKMSKSLGNVIEPSFVTQDGMVRQIASFNTDFYRDQTKKGILVMAQMHFVGGLAQPTIPKMWLLGPMY